MNNKFKTREDLVIEELEKKFKESKIETSEEEKMMTKCAEYINPFVSIIVAGMLESIKGNKVVDINFDNALEETKEKIFKKLIGK